MQTTNYKFISCNMVLVGQPLNDSQTGNVSFVFFFWLSEYLSDAT